MQVRDRLSPELAADVRMDGAALDRAGTDQRHLDRELVETARAQPRQGAHLGSALHLEDADGVSHAELVIDAGLLLRDGRQRPRLAKMVCHLVERVLKCGEHAKTQQVELHQPHRGAVVLVPLEHGAVLHPGRLDRAHLSDWSGGQHHPARVDAEVARERQQLARPARRPREAGRAPPRRRPTPRS